MDPPPTVALLRPEDAPAAGPRASALAPPGLPNRRNWMLAAGAISALVLAVLVVGLVAIVQSQRVKAVAVHALQHDIEVEDEGEDIRLAALDLRNAHRSISAGDRGPAAIADFDDAYAGLLTQIDEYAALDLAGTGLPEPARLRELADRYHGEFRPAIDNAAEDPAGFARASTAGLDRLADIEQAGREIDAYGGALARRALTDVEQVANAERLSLLALVVGAVLVGLALALAGGRLMAHLRAAYAGEHAAREELARTLQTKTDFVADASHELRTPLAVIRANADLGLAADDEEARRQSLSEIASEANRLSKLVDDLLFLARSDAGAPPLDREFVPARWLALRLEQRARALASSKGGCLDARVSGEGFLEADADRIEQAVLILVDNALRHSPPGACVELHAAARGEALEIAVADHGAGIPAAEVPLIFDRFYQIGRRRSRKEGGHGLGLSIARSIVAAHGGTLAAASRVGEGTRMTLSLPLSPSPEAGD